MAAGKYNMEVEQGETFQRAFRIKNKTTGVLLDLSGWTAAMQVRKSYSSPTALLTLTTANGKLTIVTGQDYNALLVIPHADTAGTPAGEYVYDIEFSDGSIVRKYLKGKFNVFAEVTKV